MIEKRFGGLAGFALAGMLAGCTPPISTSTPSGTSPAEPVTVHVVQPMRKTIRRVIEQPAQVEAFEETPLVARIPGTLVKVPLDIGDPIRGPRYDEKGRLVEPGTLLAQLWVPELVQEHAQKQALVQQAHAEVEQAQALVAVAVSQSASAKALIKEAKAGQTRADAAYARWESEFRRVEKLVQSRVIDEQSRDEVRNQFSSADAARQEQAAKVATAQAGADESVAKENKARADVNAVKAHVAVAEADANRLAALLEFGQVRAPYDGVVTRRNMHTGQYVQPGPTAPPLFVVCRTDKVRLLVDVPEADTLVIADGMPATISVQALKHRSFTGKVSRNSWALDPKTHTLRIQVELPNPNGVLRPGMYALVTLTRDFPDRLVLPASAVMWQGEQPSAFIIDGPKAYRVHLKTGLRDSSGVEVLQLQRSQATGANAAEWVGVTPQQTFVRDSVTSLADGQQVSTAKASE